MFVRATCFFIFWLSRYRRSNKPWGGKSKRAAFWNREVAPHESFSGIDESTQGKGTRSKCAHLVRRLNCVGTVQSDTPTDRLAGNPTGSRSFSKLTLSFAEINLTRQGYFEFKPIARYPGDRALIIERLVRRLCVGYPFPSLWGCIQGICFVPVRHAFAVTASHLACHEATKRFVWLLGRKQGD